MPRYGALEYFRQKHLCLVMFIGFFAAISYSSIVSNSGRLIADVSLVVGLLLFSVALIILGGYRIQ